MLLSPDFFNALNENFIQTDGCWAWSTEDVYSIGYKELLSQPINLNTVSLDYFRFKAPTTEITIRYGTTSASPFIFQGYSYNISEFDDVQEVVDHNSLNGLQGGSTTERYHLSASTYNFLQTVSADVQTQINTLKQMSVSGMGAGTINRVGKFVTSGSLGDSSINDDGSLVKIHNPLSASGNISANSFVKSGGTSAQFLKANGSSDSNVYITSSSLTPYTLTTTTSAISANFNSKINSISSNYTTRTEVSAVSANLQNQINNDKNSLSAYLPLSGGNVYGRLYLGNSSNNGYLDLRTNGTSVGQTDINYRGSTSALRRMTIRYDEIQDAIEIFSSNDDGSARTNIQRMYRNASTPSRFYTGLDVATGNFSVQSLSASKLVATDASKNLISYTLTSADIPNLSNIYYPVSSTGNISGLNSPAQTQLNNISANFTTRTEVSAVSGNLQTQINNNNNKLSTYLPLSGGNVYGSTTFGNSSNNAYLSLRTNGTSAGQADLNFLGSTSASRRLTFRFNEITNALELFTSNDDGSSRANKMIVYRNSSSPTNFYTGLNVATGNFSVQSLSASKLVATDSSKNLISYNLTSADIPSISNLYLPLSGGTLSGQLLVKSNVSASGDIIGSRHIIPGGLASQFLKADGSVDSNSYALDTLGSYYLPLSGGTLNGDMATQNIRPVAPFSYNLGSVFFPFYSLYVSAINANKINMEGSIIPINSISYDLGSDSYKWNKIYTKDFTSVAMSTTTDRNVEAVDVKSHVLLGFDDQLAPHLNFSPGEKWQTDDLRRTPR